MKIWKMVAVTEKYCSRGKHTLPVTEFNSHDYTRDGLQHWCRHCQREYHVGYLKAKRHSLEVAA